MKTEHKCHLMMALCYSWQVGLPGSSTGGFPLTSLLLRSHAAVSVSGQGPRRSADAVVGARCVHAAAVLAVGRVLALIHTCGAAEVQSRGLILRSDPGSVDPHPPIIVARTHFFLLASGIHGWLQLHKKEPSVLTQWPLAHRDSSWHSFTSEGAERRRIE